MIVFLSESAAHFEKGTSTSSEKHLARSNQKSNLLLWFICRSTHCLVLSYTHAYIVFVYDVITTKTYLAEMCKLEDKYSVLKVIKF